MKEALNHFKSLHRRTPDLIHSQQWEPITAIPDSEKSQIDNWEDVAPETPAKSPVESSDTNIDGFSVSGLLEEKFIEDCPSKTLEASKLGWCTIALVPLFFFLGRNFASFKLGVINVSVASCFCETHTLYCFAAKWGTLRLSYRYNEALNVDRRFNHLGQNYDIYCMAFAFMTWRLGKRLIWQISLWIAFGHYLLVFGKTA
jgi:hypothetical protein